MKHKIRAVVSVTNDLYTDNRVDKICVFLQDQGYDVLLVGRLRKNSKDLPARSYATKRMRLLFEKGPFFYASFNFRLFMFLLFRKADVLVSNDLDTLLANYLASKFKKCRLVYDSHEYFTEVPELTNRPKVQKFWLRIEEWIFPKLQTIYTVNQSIANLYRSKYKQDVQVVRNISPHWNSSELKTKKQLEIPQDKFIIIMQGAGINIHRGAEEAVEAMKEIDDSVLLIVGDGDVIEQLKSYVATHHLSKKVLFFGKRPYQEMMNFTFHADVGLTLDKANNINYQYSLPNKVFDYIHASTPIICTDLVEVKNIVERNKVGIVLKEFTVSTLVQNINKLKDDPELLKELKENCKSAANKENWEEEKKVLQKIYPKIEQ